MHRCGYRADGRTITMTCVLGSLAIYTRPETSPRCAVTAPEQQRFPRLSRHGLSLSLTPPPYEFFPRLLQHATHTHRIKLHTTGYLCRIHAVCRKSQIKTCKLYRGDCFPASYIGARCQYAVRIRLKTNILLISIII